MSAGSGHAAAGESAGTQRPRQRAQPVPGVQPRESGWPAVPPRRQLRLYAASSGEKKIYTVPAGTKVLLQLRSAVNTKSAKAGDGVYLASTFPVVVGNR